MYFLFADDCNMRFCLDFSMQFSSRFRGSPSLDPDSVTTPPALGNQDGFIRIADGIVTFQRNALAKNEDKQDATRRGKKNESVHQRYAYS